MVDIFFASELRATYLIGSWSLRSNDPIHQYHFTLPVSRSVDPDRAPRDQIRY